MIFMAIPPPAVEERKLKTRHKRFARRSRRTFEALSGAILAEKIQNQSKHEAFSSIASIDRGKKLNIGDRVQIIKN
jgi:hypothetical protein